jgi:carbon-monoxide dehydrogenase small subunit
MMLRVCLGGDFQARSAWRPETPPTDSEIRFGHAGNLCRFTGYDKIVRSVQEAAVQFNAGTMTETPANEMAS